MEAAAEAAEAGVPSADAASLAMAFGESVWGKRLNGYLA